MRLVIYGDGFQHKCCLVVLFSNQNGKILLVLQIIRFMIPCCFKSCYCFVEVLTCCQPVHNHKQQHIFVWCYVGKWNALSVTAVTYFFFLFRGVPQDRCYRAKGKCDGILSAYLPLSTVLYEFVVYPICLHLWFFTYTFINPSSDHVSSTRPFQLCVIS